MVTKEYEWHKIAEHPQELLFNEGSIAVVQVNDSPYCIGRFQEQLFGFAHRCPHAAVPLSGGYIDAKGNVVCPLHFYKFSIRSGQNTSGEGYLLPTWPVACRPDGVYLGLTKKS